MNVRPITSFTADEIRVIAREAAETGDPMRCPFPAGTPQAAIFERSFLERELQLDPQGG